MQINARLPFLRNGLFRLRNILLIVMLTVLALPLGGLYFFRIYENELVRQTEVELIAQSAVLAATYRQLMRLDTPQPSLQIAPIHAKAQENAVLSAAYKAQMELNPSGYFTPVFPTLDLTGTIEPPRPNAKLTTLSPSPKAFAAGQAMNAILLNTQQITLAGIRILDAQGLVIAGKEEIGLSLAHVPEVRQALRGQFQSVIRQRISDEPPPPLYSISRGTNIRVFTAFPILEQRQVLGVIYLSRTPNNIVKHLYAVRKVMLTATLSLLCVAVLLVLFVSSSISRPIRELIKQTERVTQGEQRIVEPIKHPVTYEVAQLSDSFASMSKTLAERSDYIRRFAAHVSHEFKTPLTSMQGALELLQEHLDTMSSERRQRFLTNLMEDTQRLKNLVTRLLELARADALEPSRQTSVLPELLNTLANRYQERGLVLNYRDLATQALPIAPEALDSVLNNLLENSLYHKATEVVITMQAENYTWHIDVADNGEGISPANRDKIFTPFFTTRRSQGGTGLGLEITQSLLRAYKGDLVLLPTAIGATFRLKLPFTTLL
ncbi:MAG: HAMP domain-containing sensor histidine kinase [Thiofilum sp.]|uniref:HAMP domain-containing sensor histidine kinase n=1 Tax=Thiofilum sp. TaxID=2212733 RepID=UPI0025DA955C|nr:HAMP domain-containing sensor histidine kinase [Thiofilum sp.]MBK8452830.1 HAMP domain-containing histidine kinase [Thiofilum sp.]